MVDVNTLGAEVSGRSEAFSCRTAVSILQTQSGVLWKSLQIPGSLELSDSSLYFCVTVTSEKRTSQMVYVWFFPNAWCRWNRFLDILSPAVRCNVSPATSPQTKPRALSNGQRSGCVAVGQAPFLICSLCLLGPLRAVHTQFLVLKEDCTDNPRSSVWSAHGRNEIPQTGVAQTAHTQFPQVWSCRSKSRRERGWSLLRPVSPACRQLSPPCVLA